MNNDDIREIQLRNINWEIHRQLRIEKGRTGYNVCQPRRDHKHYRSEYTRHPDPILDLYVARVHAVRSPNDPRAQVRYGEIRQLVVSPVGPLP